MENASKALIIAAAILLAIAIISIGIYVLRIANDASKNVDLSSTEVVAFNAQFDGYVGGRVTASKVRALVDAIEQSNKKEDTSETKRHINIMPNDFSVDNITASKTYKVEGTKGGSAGVYTEFKITENNN